MLQFFGCGPELVSETLRHCPNKMWLYRPADSRWSIYEIILHLADSEAEAYIVFRKFIAEPGSAVSTCDIGTWADKLGYFHQRTREALGLIVRLRRMTYRVLRYIPETVWAHTARHPRKGIIVLDDWLDMQARHIPHHLEQIHQNYAEWTKTHPTRKPAIRRARNLNDCANHLAEVMTYAHKVPVCATDEFAAQRNG